MRQVIWQKSKTGCHEVIVTLPTRWQGEADCVVGPFSSRDVAEYFANNVVDFGQFEDLAMRVFASGDAWYVEVTSANGGTVTLTPPRALGDRAARAQRERAAPSLYVAPKFTPDRTGAWERTKVANLLKFGNSN